MFWRDDSDDDAAARLPDDVVDLLFRVDGDRVDVDHAWALARGLGELLDDDLLGRIGVHGIRLAGSGNGWIRPDAPDASLPLSRRSRLEIRLHRDDAERLRALSGLELPLGARSIALGEVSERRLTPLDTLYARAVSCTENEDESRLLERIAAELAAMEIDVTRMICGRAGRIRTDAGVVHTRAVMVADLAPEQSVRLQQRGIGGERLLGCGLFVPHKGIDAVHEKTG